MFLLDSQIKVVFLRLASKPRSSEGGSKGYSSRNQLGTRTSQLFWVRESDQALWLQRPHLGENFNYVHKRAQPEREDALFKGNQPCFILLQTLEVVQKRSLRSKMASQTWLSPLLAWQSACGNVELVGTSQPVHRRWGGISQRDRVYRRFAVHSS